MCSCAMWTLSRLFPFVIGHNIPEGNLYWETFLLLLTIMDYLLGPVILPDGIGFLIGVALPVGSGACDMKVSIVLQGPSLPC